MNRRSFFLGSLASAGLPLFSQSSDEPPFARDRRRKPQLVSIENSAPAAGSQGDGALRYHAGRRDAHAWLRRV